MKHIEFENFRRFQDFPKMELGDVNFLVGSNNAGKSTLLYAIMLAYDNLSGMHADRTNSKDECNIQPKSNILDNEPRFVFTSKVNSDLFITFDEALCNKAVKPVISFGIGVGDFEFMIDVKRDEEPNAGKVAFISVKDNLKKIKFDIDLDNKEYTYYFNIDNEEQDSSLIVKAKMKRFVLDTVYERSLLFYIRNTIDSIKYDKTGDNSQFNRTVLDHKDDINSMLNRLDRDLDLSLEYIPLYITNKDSIYREGTLMYKLVNAHSQSLCESNYLNVSRKKPIFDRKFNRWLKMFDVGESVTLDFDSDLDGVFIKVKKGEGFVKFKNLGSGARHIFILLLWVQYLANNHKHTTVIVEEPEQNLHPKLQSKLADLFWELNKEFGIQFIVETHSEYLIRRTQYLVAKNYGTPYKLVHNNPFKVYYFSDNGEYYEMRYKTDGFFKRAFEEGFFDESTKLYNDTIKAGSHE